MRKAVGIIRVSEAGDREGDSFISPGAQRQRIEEKCSQLGLELIETEPEINVSGGKPLKRRKGLLWGVEAIEAGDAQVLIVGYFDRLVRELRVQWEVVSRVEAAGGEVLAVDFGRISEETAVQWLSATMIGAVHEYLRRSTKEKTEEAKADAIARGIPTYPDIPPGYRREVIGRDGTGRPKLGPFVPDEPKAQAIRDAFEMRAREAPGREIESFLRKHGIRWRRNNLAALFRNRVYLGELHFGEHLNRTAHEGIVDPDLFDRAQRATVRRGRYAKSDFLLARLDVLRCHEGRRMVASTQTQRGKKYPGYSCPGDLCDHPVAISAAIVEPIVRKAVEDALAGIEGRASVEQHARDAEDGLRRAQDRLAAAIRAFSEVEDEIATQERLSELRRERDAAQELVDQLRSSGDAITVTAASWESLTLAERRDLIRAVVREVVISPGRGANRVSVKLFA